MPCSSCKNEMSPAGHGPAIHLNRPSSFIFIFLHHPPSFFDGNDRSSLSLSYSSKDSFLFFNNNSNSGNNGDLLPFSSTQQWRIWRVFDGPVVETIWRGARKSTPFWLAVTVKHRFEIVLAALPSFPSGAGIGKRQQRHHGGAIQSRAICHQIPVTINIFSLSVVEISRAPPPSTALKCFTLQNRCRHRGHPLPRYDDTPSQRQRLLLLSISSGESHDY